jgi:molybdopterin molybdotransferase
MVASPSTPAAVEQTPQPHPMVPVPDAVRIVLHETARILWETHSGLTDQVVAVRRPADCHCLIGRTLRQDVVQRDPGYPPYRASVMDGYAIQGRSTGDDASHSPAADGLGAANDETWTHRVVDKVFAGDSIKTCAPNPNERVLTTTTTTTTGGPTTTTTTTTPRAVGGVAKDDDVRQPDLLDKVFETAEAFVCGGRAMDIWKGAGDGVLDSFQSAKSGAHQALHGTAQTFDAICEQTESYLLGGRTNRTTVANGTVLNEADPTPLDVICEQGESVVCSGQNTTITPPNDISQKNGIVLVTCGHDKNEVMTKPSPTSTLDDSNATPKWEEAKSVQEKKTSVNSVSLPLDVADDASTATTSTTSLLPMTHYVTTGAIVPDGYDRVVPMEECTVSSDGRYVRIRNVDMVKGSTKNAWIRPCGFDSPAGSVVLPAGHVIRAMSLGLILQSGVTHVHVRQPVTVGVLSTGNELEDDDEASSSSDAWVARQHGKIPDVNRPVLMNLLSSWGYCKVVDLGIARDSSKEQLGKRIQEAAKNCQIILTTGGISMGESDIVEDVLLNHLNARWHFGRLNMKPGKPTTLFTLPNDRLVFCLPGNPVSAAVCAELLVRPCLHLWFHGPDASPDNYGDSLDEQLRRTVENAWAPPELQVALNHDIKLDMERPEYHRVILDPGRGTSCAGYKATSTGIQQSSRLMSMRDAHGLMVLPKGTKEKPNALAGESYTVLWLGKDDESLWLPQVRVRSSGQLTNTSKAYTVGVILLGENNRTGRSKTDLLTHLSHRIAAALSGSKSGSVSTSCAHVFDGPLDESLYALLCESKVDIVVLVTSLAESFANHTMVANWLRLRLSKLADAMALQIRRGASSQDSQAAMYENVVGYLPENGGSMVVLLSDHGLEGGLGLVRGLIKHALIIASSVVMH